MITNQAAEPIPRIYLCGPMTGLPDYNYPAFNTEAARLRALGYHVENPAENVLPELKDWAGYMRVALTQMLTCTAIALLPNWEKSKGAQLEVQVADALDLAVCLAEDINEGF
jgi:Domain of unknown function (DUF4406)